MTWFKQGKLKPHVSKTYKFEEAAQALKDMDPGSIDPKIVIVPSR